MAKAAASPKGRNYLGVDSQKRRQKRRAALIEAGLELFGTRGYRATRVKPICDAAKLSERYFYESFANREELLAAVYNKLARDLDARLREVLSETSLEPEKRLRRILEIFFRFIRDDPRRGRVMLFEVLGVAPEIDRRHQAAVRAFAEVLGDPGPDSALFPADSLNSAAQKFIGIGLVGAVVHVGIQWIVDGFEPELDDVVSACQEIYQTTSMQLQQRKQDGNANG